MSLFMYYPYIHNVPSTEDIIENKIGLVMYQNLVLGDIW